MASRQQEKERRRQERLAREHAKAAKATRRRRLQLAGAGATAITAIAVAVVLIASGSGASKPRSPVATAPPAGAGATAGLQATRAPWPPEYTQLATRLAALRLPGQSDAGFHIHAELRIFVNGQRVAVPADIGIDPEGRFISPLHTHDTTGIIHMEATRPYPFTLGQFFTIWGVAFGAHQLGAYRDRANRRV